MSSAGASAGSSKPQYPDDRLVADRLLEGLDASLAISPAIHDLIVVLCLVHNGSPERSVNQLEAAIELRDEIYSAALAAISRTHVGVRLYPHCTHRQTPRSPRPIQRGSFRPCPAWARRTTNETGARESRRCRGSASESHARASVVAQALAVLVYRVAAPTTCQERPN